MLVILVGKSASGKDTIAKELIADAGFEPLVSVTTRPIREGEIDGVDYDFLSREAFGKMIMDDALLEHRRYETINNGKPDVWFYGTPKVSLNPKRNYVKIADIDGAKSLIEHYGVENCFVAYVFAEDTVRQKRAESRSGFERKEWERRLVSDTRRFANTDEVANYIAINNTNDLDSTIYYLTKAIQGYANVKREKGEKYNCALYENENGDIKVKVISNSECKEFEERVKRLCSERI